MIRVSAFRWVPPFAQGLVRNLRVRWALEEAGLAYEERLIGPEDQKSENAAYRLRCEARPAFQRALAAQMAPFARNAPPGQ